MNGEFDTIKLAKIAGAGRLQIGPHRHGVFQAQRRPRYGFGRYAGQRPDGPFRLLTRSKDVRLTGVNGDVRLENENGAVEIHMNKLGNMQVSNRNSDVQIYLPDKAGFQLDARSRGGEIESDFDALKIDNGDDQATASGTVGAGGPHLVINNEHGGIELRKGSSLAEATPPPKPPRVPGGAQGTGTHRQLTVDGRPARPAGAGPDRPGLCSIFNPSHPRAMFNFFLKS